MMPDAAPDGPPPPRIPSLLLFALAVSLLIVLTYAGFNDPTVVQNFIWASLLALACAITLASLPGTIQLNIENKLTATGAVAVFVFMIYMLFVQTKNQELAILTPNYNQIINLSGEIKDNAANINKEAGNLGSSCGTATSEILKRQRNLEDASTALSRISDQMVEIIGEIRGKCTIGGPRIVD